MEFGQNNTKIKHYPVVLFQHKKYEIYSPTYSLIFRKNFSPVKMNIHHFNIENFPMDHRYEQPF